MVENSNLTRGVSIERGILFIRGRRVILDAHLAELYGVPTKVLNQAVKRNRNRFPEDFVFRLTFQEAETMRSQLVIASNRSQIVTGSQKHRDPRFLPYAFTEHGAIMAASVLNSRRAVEMSVAVVRAFVRLRWLLSTHRRLREKLAELERRVDTHDETILELTAAIRRLMDPPPESPKRRIGFR